MQVGEADPCDRPQGPVKEHYKTFTEQTTWRPIPVIGRQYPHPPFCLGSTCYPTEPIPSILLTESARGDTQVYKIRGCATEPFHLLLMGIGTWGADIQVGRKNKKKKGVRKISGIADAAGIDLRAEGVVPSKSLESVRNTKTFSPEVASACRR